MKNVYVLSTNKPSRLLYDKEESCYLPLQDKLVVMDHQHLVENRHIYITISDSEIKEGDWFISTKSNNLFKADSIEYFKYYNLIEDFNKSFYLNSKNAKKIVFTDDEDLINDGVQAVTDEFLEWFIKNPSCECVEVGYGFIKLTETDNKGYWISIFNAEFNIQEKEPKQETLEEQIVGYRLKPHIDRVMIDSILKNAMPIWNDNDKSVYFIRGHVAGSLVAKLKELQVLDLWFIPIYESEEVESDWVKEHHLEYYYEKGVMSDKSKQETLEEAAEEYAEYQLKGISDKTSKFECINDFIAGANWQAERMYSEEDVYKILLNYQSNYPYANNETGLTKWFKQFKKK